MPQCGGDQSWSVPECSLELNMSQGQRDMEFPANSDVIIYFSTEIQYIFIFWTSKIHLHK